MNKKSIYWIVLVLMFIGLGVSIHLLQIDYNVKFDSSYVPSCDVNDTVSCSKVAESEYSSIAGVPVASWGILGYLFVILFMFTSRKSKRFHSSLLFFFFIFSAGSIYFFIIAKFVIEAFCIFCITTYIINWLAFALILLSTFKLKYDEEKFCLKDNFKSLFDIPFVIIPLYIVLGLGIVAPSYMIFSGSHTSSIKSMTKYKNAGFNKEELYGVCGAENPAVKIVLYSDYECPYCERFETTIKKIVEEFSNVQLIRKEFPMDNKCNMLINKEFHKHACDAALFAKCSGVQGKFWEAADLLHLNRKSLSMNNLMSYADDLKLNKKEIKKCMKSEDTMNRLKFDIKEGLKAGVQGTPGFLVNGKFHSGAKSYEDLRKIVVEAGAKVASTYKNARFNKEELYGVCGAENADVKIALYSDYECPYCERFEVTIKKIVNNFSNVELIRKEFPLDNKCNMLLGDREFHKHACDAALFAKCAGIQGKFWETADLLHLNKKSLGMTDLMTYAEKLNLNKEEIKKCMKSETTMKMLKSDIAEGLKAGVKGTPGFIVNGKTHSGAQSYEKLHKIVLEAGGKVNSNSKLENPEK